MAFKPNESRVRYEEKRMWSASKIIDPHYRATFIDVPDVIEARLADRGGLDEREILDFGCGPATTALALALRYPKSRVTGVDIVPDIMACQPKAATQLGLECLPSNLTLHQISPGVMPDPDARFDVIYNWSVFEHIEQRLLPQVSRQLHDMLKPGGSLFVQVNPLYYSHNGAHLRHLIPEPWAHLTCQGSIYEEKMAQASDGDADLFASIRSLYYGLNRMTAPLLVRTLQNTGFEIVTTLTDRDEQPLPAGLLDVYNEDVLRTPGIELVARRMIDI
jgi:SAM-dependent methyltransferase